MNTSPDWAFWIIAGAVMVAWLAWKRLGLVPADQAVRQLKEGAVVIDVRTAREYARAHLPRARNVPLGEVAEKIERVAPDRDQVLLLHCVSGGRSGIARGILRRKGYRQVHNLGSYARAADLLRRAGLT